MSHWRHLVKRLWNRYSQSTSTHPRHLNSQRMGHRTSYRMSSMYRKWPTTKRLIHSSCLTAAFTSSDSRLVRTIASNPDSSAPSRNVQVSHWWRTGDFCLSLSQIWHWYAHNHGFWKCVSYTRTRPCFLFENMRLLETRCITVQETWIIMCGKVEEGPGIARSIASASTRGQQWISQDRLLSYVCIYWL